MSTQNDESTNQLRYLRDFLKLRKTMPSHLKKYQLRFVGPQYTNPQEEISHYVNYALLLLRKFEKLKDQRILDLGGLKLTNMALSLHHQVTAIVLEKPHDNLSNVTWDILDANNKLPYPTNSFSAFISLASLHTIGTGRYGDKIRANPLPELIEELERVLVDNATILISVPIGPRVLNWNSGWTHELDDWLRFFKNWQALSITVDRGSMISRKRKGDPSLLFGIEGYKSLNLKAGEYVTCFLELQRKAD